MTALVALQTYEMDEIVKFTWDDIGFLEYGDAHIGIKPDEEVKMLDCMYAMMFASANEVSHAIASHYEGGYEAFIDEMNRISTEIGCTNSHWVNTYGLHDPEHYTSVHDMAIIGSEVFKYELFRQIESEQSHEIPETNITNEKRYAWQNHKMVYPNHRHYYEYCVGGKTGFTDQALTTLVTFASKDNMNLVAVVMRTHGGGNNAYLDTREMLDYAFENFEKVPLNVSVDAVVDENGTLLKDAVVTEVTVPMGQSSNVSYTVEAPTELEDRTADIKVLYGTREITNLEAEITEEYYNEIHGIKPPKEEKDKEENSLLSMIVKVFLVVLGVAVVAFVGLLIYVSYRRKQIEKRRRLRRMQRRREMEERGYQNEIR
jgi:D-alanyl-D-alanine carboxypeptidase